MADQSTCMSPLCGITIDGTEKKCPKCGWGMRGSRSIRIRGWFLFACGLFIVLLMGTITWNMSPMLLHPEQANADGTFTGTPDQARTFLNLFLLVILFGALATANGLYMIMSGRQNRWVVIGTVVLALILYGSAYSIIHGSK